MEENINVENEYPKKVYEEKIIRNLSESDLQDIYLSGMADGFIDGLYSAGCKPEDISKFVGVDISYVNDEILHYEHAAIDNEKFKNTPFIDQYLRISESENNENLRPSEEVKGPENEVKS